jgi:hypothetical protein
VEDGRDLAPGGGHAAGDGSGVVRDAQLPLVAGPIPDLADTGRAPVDDAGALSQTPCVHHLQNDEAMLVVNTIGAMRYRLGVVTFVG